MSVDRLIATLDVSIPPETRIRLWGCEVRWTSRFGERIEFGVYGPKGVKVVSLPESFGDEQRPRVPLEEHAIAVAVNSPLPWSQP